MTGDVVFFFLNLKLKCFNLNTNLKYFCFLFFLFSLLSFYQKKKKPKIIPLQQITTKKTKQNHPLLLLATDEDDDDDIDDEDDDDIDNDLDLLQPIVNFQEGSHDFPQISVRKFKTEFNIASVTSTAASTMAKQVRVRKQYYLNKSASKSRKFDDAVVCKCGRSFSYENLYTYHKRWECGQELKCRWCHRSYCSVYYVKRHMKRCKRRTSV